MYCLTADGWFLAEGRWPPLAGEGLSSHQLGFSSRSASRTPILTQLNEQSFVLMVFKSASGSRINAAKSLSI